MITDIHTWEAMDYKFKDAEYGNAIDFHNFGLIYDHLDHLERLFFNMTGEDYNVNYNGL